MRHLSLTLFAVYMAAAAAATYRCVDAKCDDSRRFTFASLQMLDEHLRVDHPGGFEAGLPFEMPYRCALVACQGKRGGQYFSSKRNFLRHLQSKCHASDNDSCMVAYFDNPAESEEGSGHATGNHHDADVIPAAHGESCGIPESRAQVLSDSMREKYANMRYVKHNFSSSVQDAAAGMQMVSDATERKVLEAVKHVVDKTAYTEIKNKLARDAEFQEMKTVIEQMASYSGQRALDKAMFEQPIVKTVAIGKHVVQAKTSKGSKKVYIVFSFGIYIKSRLHTSICPLARDRTFFK